MEMSADIYDNVGVTKVEFYIGANKVGDFDAEGSEQAYFSAKIGNLGFACLSAYVIAYDVSGNRTIRPGSTQCY